MTAFLMLKLAAAMVSVALAAGLLARDHGLKANRLIAAFLLCNAFWAGSEFFLYRAHDVEVATTIYRVMGFGWVPLGVLCAHASVTLSAMEQHRVSRILPYCYASLLFVLPMAVWTDLVVVGAERIPVGWRAVFGPGMIVAYLVLAAPLLAVLASWRNLLKIADSTGQLLLARVVFFGISGALLAGTLTAVLLPIFKIDTVGVSTALVSLVGVAVALTLRRFGHSLIAPEAFAREILDTLEDGVILVGEDGRLRDANVSFLRMIGEPEWAAIGRPIKDWVCDFPDLSEAPSISTLHQLSSRAGSPLPVVLSSPVACRRGGRLVGHALLVRDRREIVSLQRQLVVSARLAAVGDLAKSISKSISEPTTHVREDLEGLALDWSSVGDALLLAGLEEPCREAVDEGKELISECVEGVDRVVSIVREVAGFSGDAGREAFAPHSLDQIVRRAVRVAEAQAQEGVSIEVRLDPDVKILCHFAEIERVVTNLLVNGLHALSSRPPGKAHLVVAVAAQAGRALLHVEDDGCGIEAEALDRVFDPFFTTKPVGKGTGLGLAISYHIVKAHGGEIRVSSIPGRGTSVAVELPRAPLQSAEVA